VNRARFRRLALAGAVLLLVAGCGGSDPAEEAANQLEDVLENVGDGSVAIDIDDDGSVNIDVQGDDGDGGDVSISSNDNDGSVAIQVDGEDGSMVIGGGDVPDGFPIPIPDGGQVLSSFSGSSDSGAGSSVLVQYPPGSYDDLVSTFASWIDANTSESGTFNTDTADGKSTQFFGEAADGSAVIVVVTDDGTDVLATLTVGSS
jgi:hypothetical protein